MRRRLWLLTAGSLALLGMTGLLLVAALLRPAPAVTWENFEHIVEGMAEGDVEALMGGPGKTLPLSRNDDLQHGAVQKEWQGEYIQIFVVFDRNGAALAKGPSFVESGVWMEPRRPAILSRLRRLLF